MRFPEVDEAGCCVDCGRQRQIGDWPKCPHADAGVATFRDDIPGGLTVENYGPKPLTFYSHSERRQYMKDNGLYEREKFSPLPGTDKDPQGIPNPAGYIDNVTMQNRAELFLRAHSQRRTPEFDAVEAGVLTGEFSGTMTTRDAIAVTTGDKRRQSRLHRRTSGTHTGSEE